MPYRALTSFTLYVTYIASFRVKHSYWRQKVGHARSVDLRVHGCRRQLDEVQQATAKRWQNGSSVVHDWSATTSTPQWHTDDRRYSCFRVVIRARPGNTYWRRSDDVDACSENCVALLRRPPSAASNSSLSAAAYVPVAGGHSGKLTTTLWPILCVVCSQSSTQPRDSRRYCSLNHIITFGWSDILFLHTVYSGPSSVWNT